MKLQLSMTILLAMFLGGLAQAQRMDEAVVKFVNVTTGDTATVQTSDFKYNGHAEQVSAVFTTNHTINIRVSAYNEYSDVTRTIYENTNGVGTAFTVYPRTPTHTTSGSSMAADKEYIRIPLIKDKIKYEVWGASATNQTVTILFYYSGM